jgi:hypothetical protein
MPTMTIGNTSVPQRPEDLDPGSYLGRLYQRAMKLAGSTLPPEERERLRDLRQQRTRYETVIGSATAFSDHGALAAAQAGLPLVERDIRQLEVMQADASNAARMADETFMGAWAAFRRDCSDLEEALRTGRYNHADELTRSITNRI